jgi:murein DD-endopeptidase MepM/ murein hydrolase activator NlpD
VVKNSLSQLSKQLNYYKARLLRRMFWGRGNAYKNAFHIIIVIMTVLLVQTGLITRSDDSDQVKALDVNYGIYGNSDLLLQGETISTVVAVDRVANFKVTTHVVGKRETLEGIAKRYRVSENTIIWANEDKIDYYDRNVITGDRLKIPQIDGVLLALDKNDTLKTVLKKVNNGNRFDVIEINELVGPKYSLKGKKSVFIPGATKDPPPPKYDDPRGTAPSNEGYIPSPYSGAAIGGLPAGFFDDPLTHPGCAGYGYSRGYRPGTPPYGHTGVDLTKAGGCPIRAAGAGTVTFAGWGMYGTGIAVTIDHGGGVITSYYHGSEVWVNPGQRIDKGDLIMQMGCTGNCSGTHLHLTMKLNGTIIDPASYIPYRR